MKSHRIAISHAAETLLVVLDDGEEAFSTLQDFARKESIAAASPTAIGAFAHAMVGRFDFATKSYQEILVDEQCEVLSAIGDIATGDDGRPSLHVKRRAWTFGWYDTWRPSPEGHGASDARGCPDRNPYSA